MRRSAIKETPRMPTDTAIIVTLITLIFIAFALTLAYGDWCTRNIQRD